MEKSDGIFLSLFFDDLDFEVENLFCFAFDMASGITCCLDEEDDSCWLLTGGICCSLFDDEDDEDACQLLTG